MPTHPDLFAPAERRPDVLYRPGLFANLKGHGLSLFNKRPHIILPDDGLTLNHFGGAANMAHAVLLAVDRETVAAGQIYNCGDIKILSLKQVVDVCAAALDHQWEVVSMPNDLAVSARPLLSQPGTTHRVFDLTKIRMDLGYSDIVDPLQGIAEAACWYAEHPIDAYGDKTLQDPYDYAAEDALVVAWRQAMAKIPRDLFVKEPGYTSSYSGPGGTKRKSDW